MECKDIEYRRCSRPPLITLATKSRDILTNILTVNSNKLGTNTLELRKFHDKYVILFWRKILHVIDITDAILTMYTECQSIKDRFPMLNKFNENSFYRQVEIRYSAFRSFTLDVVLVAMRYERNTPVVLGELNETAAIIDISALLSGGIVKSIPVIQKDSSSNHEKKILYPVFFS